MMPSAKMSSARGPAIGFNASAAWAELWMSVLPCACKVAAVVMMIESAIRFENAIPISVSRRIRRNSSGASEVSFFNGFLLASIRWSSASCDDCQMKR